jgi:hypothetical protein
LFNHALQQVADRLVVS